MCHYQSGKRPASWVHLENSIKLTPPPQSDVNVDEPQPTSYGPTKTGADRLLKDIDLVNVDEPIKRQCTACTKDIDAFFSLPHEKEGKDLRDCKGCLCQHCDDTYKPVIG
ncbi:hypothetical protein F5141DRAFT_1060791 [Pisolithus sp. B1]|nr:hypothetical protein F5141DRAFT_1060791 [Pisolithus sp. B1]